MSQIITVEQLADYTGKPLAGDKRAIAIVNSVNDWAEAYTGRIIGEVRELVEYHDYAPVIFLNKMDIQEVRQLEVFGTVQNAPRVNKNTGRMVLDPDGTTEHSRGGYDAVEVTYTAGMAEVPADIQTACLAVAARAYNNRVEQGITAESLGGYSVSYADVQAVRADGQSSLTDPMAVFNAYRLRRL